MRIYRLMAILTEASAVIVVALSADRIETLGHMLIGVAIGTFSILHIWEEHDREGLR